jgi:tetratricopeptide (TPR) repeat protein
LNTRPAPSKTVGVVVRAVAARFLDRPADDAVRKTLIEATAVRPVPHEVASRCARVLLDAGLLEEAEMIYEALARLRQWEPAGPVGLAQIAVARRLWTEALAGWDAVFAAFTPRRDPLWVSGRANALTELDRAEEATQLYAELITAPASEARGYQGLAQLAMRRRDWADALARWDGLLAGFTGHPNRPLWHSRQALALLRLGRGGEAEAALRSQVHANPEMLSAFLDLLRLLLVTGRHEEALTELEASAFRPTKTAGLVEIKFNILIRLKRLKAARVAFERILDKAAEPAILGALFSHTPPLYEGWRRTAVWLALQEKVERLIEAGDPGTRHAAQILRLRLQLALRDHRGFLSEMGRLGDDNHLGAHDRTLRAVARRLSESPYPDWRKPKVFCIGLSKTGTTSLAAALTMLGLNTVDFTNPLTMELMSESDVHIFDAFSDTPICVDFEKYFHLFPNAKFIHTVRSLESWEESFSRHWQRHYGVADFKELQVEIARPDMLPYGAAFRDINHTLFASHANPSAAHRAHDLRVRRFFADKPPGRFLEFDIFGGDGWPELCAFLGMPAPDQPFPWQNRDPTGPEDHDAA